MFETYQICPYTGLRSFTEEESIYFKGREEDIDQACSQLQRNKFLMLTGASGDGKSSLIYAGIIPNARAGFLKSKYSQWCVADFRPERTPFDNLCKSVARELGIANPHTVEAELNHGFSALVDLYKNSKRFIDTQSGTWTIADNAAKATIKHEAANLIILVDQFEEFFTNPENYQRGAVSKESNVVVNILLETARIALEEDLPIYIIFTMRSDYTGQCAAFRGLPEYIGFSQFFVPHLNRSQLQQVIEEPAVLSGNKITRRLTERLIHDVNEGVDQLPILQHALNQIWVAANNGQEEMDLLHYAMVGGMQRDELPSKDVERFNSWFDSLSAEIKSCYQAPSLQNVLDTHTNKLYMNAHRYVWEKSGLTIAAGDARNIIRMAFTCLTKIDQGRAVRNRMTLREITNIIGSPQFDFEKVGWVLNTFREPGNTFIRPFMNPDVPESLQVHLDQVLDITHESLIRNWQYLGQWAKQEFESYSTYKDFEQQLKRWVNSNKESNFLLPIGPLTFFENWNQKAKPNEWWIARYLPENTGADAKLSKAKETLGATKEFLGRSARKHVVARTFIRYGSKRMAITIALVIFLTFTSFVVKSYLAKQNAEVLRSIRSESLQLANNPKTNYGNLVALIAEELKRGNVTMKEVMNSVDDPIRRVFVVNNVSAVLVLQGYDKPRTEILRTLTLTDSLLEALPLPVNDPYKLSQILSVSNDFRNGLELAYYHRADPVFARLRTNNANRCGRWVMKLLSLQPPGFTDIQNLHTALENAINYLAFTKDQLDSIRRYLSPFENGLQSEWLRNSFDVNKLLYRGSTGYGFYFNGLYQQLAYLYAADGNSEKALQCIDTLFKYNESYFQGDYSSGGDGPGNIAAVFYSYGKIDGFDAFIDGYCARKSISRAEFYERMIARTMSNLQKASGLGLYWWMGVRINLNLQFMSRAQISYFFNRYREILKSTVHDSSEQNYLLALSYKNHGILNVINNEAPLVDELPVDKLFEEAVNYYQQLPPAYLDAKDAIGDRINVDPVNMPRKYLFLFPDYRTKFHPIEPRSFAYFYSTDVFLEYILDHNLFEKFYTDEEDLQGISDWLNDYHDIHFAPASFSIRSARFIVFRKLEEKLSKINLSGQTDFTLLYLYLGKFAQSEDDTTAMLGYYEKIRRDKILNVLRVKQLDGQINDNAFRQIGFAIKGLALTGHTKEAQSIINVFKNPVNRSSLNAYVSFHLLKENQDAGLARQFLDSAILEMNRVEDLRAGQPNRQLIAIALARENPSRNAKQAYKVIKNLPAKFRSISGVANSYAHFGQIYQARNQAPAFISDSDMASFLWNIILGLNEKEGLTTEEWKLFNEHYFYRFVDEIRYIDESN